MYLVSIVISIALFQLGLFLLSNNEPGGVGVDITSTVKWLVMLSPRSVHPHSPTWIPLSNPSLTKSGLYQD